MRLVGGSQPVLSAVLLISVLLAASCGSGPDETGVTETPDEAAPGQPEPATSDGASALYAQIAELGLDDDELVDYLYERALEEGQVVHYAGGNSFVEEYVRAFEHEFPGVQLVIVDTGANELPERVLPEFRAGRHLVDVVNSITAVMAFVEREGVLAEHHGVVTDQGLPNEAVHPRLIEYRIAPYGVVWNTDLLDGDDVPGTFDEILEVEPPGCLALLPGTNGYVAFVDEWGEERAIQWAERFVDAGGVGRTRMDAVLSAVASGEFPCAAFANVTRAEAMIVEDGAPLAWRPAEFAPANSAALAIAENSPNPHAAALYARWLAGEGGAEALVAAGEIPLRSGARLGAERLEGWITPGSDLNGLLHFVEPQESLELLEAAQRVSDIITRGSPSS